MARSSTTYFARWRSGRTVVVRVPEALVNHILDYARQLDQTDFISHDPEAVYRTAAHVRADQPVNVAAVPQRSLFRYPGGKTWLVPYIRSWLSSLSERPKILVEPFAGGGIIGLTAGFEKLADHVILVEKDPDVAAVWKAVLSGQDEWLAREIEKFELSKKAVANVLSRSVESIRQRAFATILRNRVQRGGIMAAGAGLVKNGENGRGLASRWYPETLAKRIRAIAALRDCFSFIEGDGIEVVKQYADESDAAFFIDPPYTVASRRLYPHWQVDHRSLFSLLSQVRGDVLFTYDHTREIVALAKEFGFETQPIAMKNTHHARMTELLVGKNLGWFRTAQASPGLNSRTAQEKLAFHQ